MKNKILFLGSLCLIMALGLVFVGCEESVQVVEFDSLASPGNVTAYMTTGTGSNRELIVRWDAVKGAGAYYIVITKEGSNNIIRISSGSILGSPISYSNIDKLETSISSSSLYNYLGTAWKVGVVAVSTRNDINNSSPGWAPGTVTIY